MLKDVSDSDSSVSPGVTHSGSAFRAYECGQHSQACELFRQELAIAPPSVPAYRGLGNALLALGKLATAAEAFERALDLAPTDEAANLGRRVAIGCLSVINGESRREDPIVASALMDKPIVADITLAIPVFNTNIAYLTECVQSVIAQTVRPGRILIIDDASTDRFTKAFIELLRNDPAFDVLTNRRNLGLGRTMNLALLQCTSTYILKMDSDDIARPKLVERFTAELKEAGDADVIGSQFQMFGATEGVTAHPRRVTKHAVISGQGYWFINNTGVLLNRRSALAVGGYGRIRRVPEDYALWVRMMLAGCNRFRNIPEVLLDYRCFPGGLHANFRKGIGRLYLIYYKLLARMAPEF